MAYLSGHLSAGFMQTDPGFHVNKVYMKSLFYFNIHWKCLLLFFFLNDGFKIIVHQRLTKRIRTNYVTKKHFFYFSVKDLVNFSKNNRDTGPT